MRAKWVKWTLFVILLLLPFGLTVIYRAMTALPETVTLATGPEGGRYREFSLQLAKAIEEKFGMNVELVHTQGSLENIKLLEDGKVDFALYQPGTRDKLLPEDTKATRTVVFVANMYSEVAHFIVHQNSGIKQSQDLLEKSAEGRKKRVAVGQKNSGDYAMSLTLLKHFGVDAKTAIKAENLNYREIEKRFAEGTLDAALITTGIEAPILTRLLTSGHCRLLSIPNTTALARHEFSVTPTVIPTGLHGMGKQAKPETEISTIALQAQLLTRQSSQTQLVREITALILDEQFLRENRLQELFRDGQQFARHKPEFAIHPGALEFYEPELQPILNSNFVEATEGMRSFLVSVLIAGYLLYRWIRDRRSKGNEHRLDQYIHKLLGIEQRQLALDENPASEDESHHCSDEIKQLQHLLDEVTHLRQEALGEFSAHQLGEDRATDCFLAMCHSLSDKINAKLTRQRFDQCTLDIIAAIQSFEPGKPVE